MANIGSKIKKLRESKGISLTVLAERSGIAKSYISSIERQLQTNPSIDFLEKVAEALDTRIEYLILDEDQQENEILDPEWVELTKEAMASGISLSQLREFIEFSKWKKDQQ